MEWLNDPQRIEARDNCAVYTCGNRKSGDGSPCVVYLCGCKFCIIVA